MRYLVVFAAMVPLHLHAENEARELRVEPAHDGARIIFKLLRGFAVPLHCRLHFGRSMDRKCHVRQPPEKCLLALPLVFFIERFAPISWHWVALHDAYHDQSPSGVPRASGNEREFISKLPYLFLEDIVN
ncbi:hypothetical protein E0K89_019460 [Aquicoccus sp. SCR17]|nr:hypothetical protein [Carideicomes alvinocaridis]